MKLKTTTPAAEHVDTIFQAALAISRESGAELASTLDGFNFTDPAERWDEIIRHRLDERVAENVRAAGGRVVKVAGARGRVVKVAVGKLLDAVGELASYRPTFRPVEGIIPAPLARRFGLGRRSATFTHFQLDAESVARLDELRQQVFKRLVVLDELFRDYPDSFSRVLAVARRTSHRLLPTREAARVSRWFDRMAAAS